ncbi:MAG TPA: proton-conducting transporter membrane subunit, partial [Dongiaceae bacterium]|nr:proton-conducting transporter membrane subunit [Dongiaceae bacterium]
MTPAPLLLVAAVGTALGILLGRFAPRLWLGVTLGAALAALAAAGSVLAGGAAWDWRSSFSLGGQPLHLQLDGLSAFFMALLCVIGGTGAWYGSRYWTGAEHPNSARAGRMWWSVLLLSLGNVLLTANGLHFLIAWEIFAISAYFLITLNRQQSEVRAAGWLYLVASHAATLALFAFFASLAAQTGSWELGPMKDHPELTP